jgi:uncharacterized protein
MLAIIGTVAAVWLLLVVLAAVFQRQMIYLPMGGEPTPPPGRRSSRSPSPPTTGSTTRPGSCRPTTRSAPSSSRPAMPATGPCGCRWRRGWSNVGTRCSCSTTAATAGTPADPTRTTWSPTRPSPSRRCSTATTSIPSASPTWGSPSGAGWCLRWRIEHPPAALVLRSGFPELADVGRSAYPFLPVRTLLRDRYPVADHLDDYDGPVLVIAGGSDRIVPTRLSRELAEVSAPTWWRSRAQDTTIPRCSPAPSSSIGSTRSSATSCHPGDGPGMPVGGRPASHPVRRHAAGSWWAGCHSRSLNPGRTWPVKRRCMRAAVSSVS